MPVAPSPMNSATIDALHRRGTVRCLGDAFLLYVFYLTGPLTVLMLISSGVLLYLEHRLAHDIELAFFKINVATGFVVLSLVVFGL